MPVLNLGIRRSGYGVAQQPRSTPDNFGAQGFEALGELGKIAAHQQLDQDKTEIATQAALMDVKFEQLREEIKAEPEFGKRDQLYQTKATEYLQSTLSSVSSPRVKEGINKYYSVKFPAEAQKTAVNNQKEFGEHRVASVDKLGEMLAERVIGSTDPQQAEEYKQLYRSQVNALSQGPYAPRRADQTTNMIQAWEKKVNLGRADAQIRANPSGFLADMAEGKYSEFDLDEKLKLGEKARKQIDDDQRAQDKVFNQVKDKVEQGWYSAAAGGNVPAAEMQDAIAGRNPYITPQKALELKRINDNPVTGEGSKQVQAIMQEYHSGSSSFGRIRAAREQLKALMRNQSSPNPHLDKAFNELQTDERTMTGIEASRVNQATREAGIEFDALTPRTGIPLLDRGLPQKRAQAELEARRGKDPKEAAKRQADQQKQRVDKIPDDVKKMREALGR